MHFHIALAALLVEAIFSYPQALYRRLGHPVTWSGSVLAWAELRFNKPASPPALRRWAGMAVLLVLVIAAFALTMALDAILTTSLASNAILVVLASSLLASRSLYVHVRDVSLALRQSGLEGGRAAVAHIVGRDVAALDQAGVARAAIESLAENFSDGVVAPLFWLLIFGLPGMVAYKIVNTADSLIGHRTQRYEDFGRAAARLDDALNFVPARISALIYLTLAWLRSGRGRAVATWRITFRDAPRHRSPNGGWPEAAMAGALGFQLNGPRCYHGSRVDEPLTGDGNYRLEARDIDDALDFYVDGCVLLAGALAVAAFLMS
ncbi:MAG: cobalamin biosynthesis protein CobD [Hyphomicrobiales bacterium]|nr:cobalamin biosynthesis protein CobD [Hyphomicrobiales bacterium]